MVDLFLFLPTTLPSTLFEYGIYTDTLVFLFPCRRCTGTQPTALCQPIGLPMKRWRRCRPRSHLHGKARRGK